MVDFKEYIAENVILGDGALGSFLYEKGVELGYTLDLLNLNQPEMVLSAHEEYIRAGSQLIETNTFGANRFKLERVGQEERVAEINRAGGEIAVKAAGHQVFVAGSVGPTGVSFPLELGETGIDDIRAAFAEQFTGLVQGGVDLFILETFSQLDEITLAIQEANRVAPDMPVVAQMLFPAKGKTQEGIDARTCARRMLAAGASVVGTNCGRGIDATAFAVKAMSELDEEDLILSAFPNAGLPEVVSHRTIYPAQPAYMAKRLEEMIRVGARLVGGCCGTTPAHIREFGKISRIKKVRARVRPVPLERTGEEEKVEQLGENKTNGGLLSSLQPDRIPVLVELDPPTHLDISHVLKGAEELGRAGVDAITLGENPLAILRTGNLGLARLIQEKTGVRTIIHQTGRDINGLGLQSRMMEAHLLGISGVLAVTGDSASATDQPNVSGVFDLNSFGLIRMLNLLNNGSNLAGKKIKKQTDFSIGAAFSFRPKNPKMQITRLERKADLGARFALTQPLFSRAVVEEMMEKVNHIDLLVLPGIFPLISARNAEFLHNEVPGISVPNEIRTELARYRTVEDQRRVALDHTRRLIDEIAPLVDGLYLISPLNKWEVTLEFVNQVRAKAFQGSGRHCRFLT